MDLTDLRENAPPALRAEIERRWPLFVELHGDDVDAFVMWLHAERVLTAEQMRDLLTAGEVAFTLSEAAARRDDRGRHRLIGLLGKGAMGEVHIARDEDLHRNVAVKRMDPSLLEVPELVQRFYTEVQITAQLDHPSIVPVYSLERDGDGTLSYAMKLVRGKTLDDFLGETRAFYKAGREPDAEHDLPSRLQLFLAVCDAMAYAHQRGVVHRDLKPENIMVGAFHEVLVMDWGIARLVGGKETIGSVQVGGDRAAATQMGMAIGTAPYMSPEQAQGLNDELDGRSDQYALGLILHEVVALKRAVTGPNSMAVLFKAAEGQKDPMAPYHAKAPIPRELVGVVAKATAKHRDHRYVSVAELAADVRRYLKDEPVLAAPDSAGQRVKRWIGKNRGTTLGLVLALVMLVIAVGAGTLSAGLAALQYSEWAAQVREERLAALGARVEGQAQQMDTELARYQGLLQGLAFTAERVLAEPAPRGALWTSDRFDAGDGPPDIQESAFYRGRISLDHPDLTLAPTADRAALEPRLHQLAALQPTFWRVIVRSQSEHLLSRPVKQQVQAVRDRGVPLVWAYVATEEGILAGFPGIGGYPDGYDPRERSWYQLANTKRGPQWGAPDADESGMGLLVTCATSLWSPDDELLGIAAVDVTFGYLIENFLDVPDLPVEAFLVDANGNVVVRSSQKDLARDAKAYVTPPFPFEPVRAALPTSTTGHMELEGGQIAAWTHLQAGGWAYVVVGDAAEMLTAQ